MSDIDNIRRQMALIRHDLHEDISAAVGGAGKVVDWRTLVRNAPWVSTGLSFAVGYFLIPRRKEGTSGWLPGPRSSFVGSESRGDDESHLARRKSGFGLGSVLGLGFKLFGPIALSAGQAYASSWIESKLLGALATVPEAPERRKGPPASDAESESFSMPRRRF